MKKKFLSILLCFTLVVGLFPTIALAEESTTYPESVTIWNNNNTVITLNSTNPYLVTNNSTAASGSAGTDGSYVARYDATTGTLYLNDYSCYRSYNGSSDLNGIDASDSGLLTIDLSGINSICADLDSTTDYSATPSVRGIYAEQLNIQGEGSLTVEITNRDSDTAYGIFTTKGMTISAKVEINSQSPRPGGTVHLPYAYGLYAQNGDIVLSGSDKKVSVTGGANTSIFANAIYAPEGSVSVSGKLDVTLESKGRAIYAKNDSNTATPAITLDGGDVTIIGNAQYGLYEDSSAKSDVPGIEIKNNSKLIMAEATGVTNGIYSANNKLSIEESSANVKATDGAAINVEKSSVSITNSDVTFTTDSTTSQAVYTSSTAENSIDLSAKGIVMAKSKNNGSDPFYPINGKVQLLTDTKCTKGDKEEAATNFKSITEDGYKVVEFTTTKPYATVADVTISGAIGSALSGTNEVNVTLVNDTFATTFTNSNWITNLPNGLSQSVQRINDKEAKITISGTPTSGSDAAMTITIPAGALYTNSAKSVTVKSNENAKFEITKATPVVTAPTAKTLTYNGEEQVLIEAGSTTGGEMQYSLTSDGGYSTDLPKAKNATTYTVYYKVVGNEMYADAAENSIRVSIGKKDVTVAPKAVTITKGSSIPTFELDYSGLVAGDVLTPNTEPTFECYETGTTPVSTSSAAGSYTIKWTNMNDVGFTGADNYNLTKTETAALTIKTKSSGSKSGGSTYTKSYDVASDKIENGAVEFSTKNASEGAVVTITTTPDKGWTLETLTVLDKNGKTVELDTVTLGEKYTFKMPANGVTVKATFMEDNKMLNYFVDVNMGDYFYDSVLWAAEKKITTGTDDLHFSPNAPCTRAQIVTFLYRAAGSPEVTSDKTFSDVEAGSYYAKAVAWAVENGITAGTESDKFSPDDTCTRAQAVTFLARALKGTANANDEFSDVDSDSYYASAVSWAKANGVTTGVTESAFGPDNDCTRAQIVTFLYRAYK